MGQDASSASAQNTRREPPSRRVRPPRSSQPTASATDTEALEGREEEHHRAPTLKEQWQAKREANVALREAQAAERKRKKDALHAALMAQQKQMDAEEAKNKSRHTGKKEAAGNGGSAAGDEDAEDLRLRQAAAEAERAMTEAQVSAQLAAFQAFMQNNPDMEEELDAVDGNPASMFDRDVASQAARKTLSKKGKKAKHGAAGYDSDETITDVSVHSSDYNDAELLQGLNDLDDELEAEFQQNIDALQAQVVAHKQQSLVYLREQNNKAAALEELQKAKELETRIKQLLRDHDTPLRAQVEEQEKKIAQLEELVASRKQESLVALRGGDKPTALEKLKESKGFHSQLDEAKAQLAALEEEKARQLRSTGDS